MKETISSRDLRPSDVPQADTGWDAIGTFALTYDGYAAKGFEGCAALANGEEPMRTLDDYRAALFFERRRWHHFGDEPDSQAMEGIARLLEKIRELASTDPRHSDRMGP